MTIGRDKRSERFIVSLTREEYQALDAQRVDAEFPSLSSYVRMILIRGPLRDGKDAEAA